MCKKCMAKTVIHWEHSAGVQTAVQPMLFHEAVPCMHECSKFPGKLIPGNKDPSLCTWESVQQDITDPSWIYRENAHLLQRDCNSYFNSLCTSKYWFSLLRELVLFVVNSFYDMIELLFNPFLVTF